MLCMLTTSVPGWKGKGDIMSTPRRYEKGVTNVAKGTTMGMFLDMDPSKIYGDFDDFFEYSATDKWVNTDVGGGAESIAADLTGGVLVIDTGGAAGNHNMFQRAKNKGTGTLVSETFLFAAGKQAWFKARFKVSVYGGIAGGGEAEDLIVYAGLHITNTDPVAAEPTDGVYFHSPTGSADLYLRVRKGSNQLTTTKVSTLQNLTWITVGYHWDGVTKLHYYIGDDYVDTLTPSTYLPDTENLALSFGIESVGDSADAMYIDYIGAWMER